MERWISGLAIKINCINCPLVVLGGICSNKTSVRKQFDKQVFLLRTGQIEDDSKAKDLARTIRDFPVKKWQPFS